MRFILLLSTCLPKIFRFVRPTRPDFRVRLCCCISYFSLENSTKPDFVCIMIPSYDIIFIIVVKNNDNLIIEEENGSQIFLLVVSVWLFRVASLILLITNFTVVKGVRCKLFQFTQEYYILRSYTTELQTKDTINTTSNHTNEKEPYENNIGADQPVFLDSVININVIESMLIFQ